jgi:hypothetical protein
MDLKEAQQLALEDRIVKLKSGEIKKHRSSAKTAEEIPSEDPKKYKLGGYT